MFYLFSLLLSVVFCEDRLSGWNYINLHCRDNENSPVDWWIIYKPPSGVGPWETGANFSYITSDSAGKWIPSDFLITSNSMLQHTLAPMYRPTYSEHLATIIYSPAAGTVYGSTGHGVLLADELGGAWLSHTVPGLPDLTQDRLKFPTDELRHGHLMVCLSSNFETLSKIAMALRDIQPSITKLRVPKRVRQWVPDWLMVNEPIDVHLNSYIPLTQIDIESNGHTVGGKLMFRSPGDKRCLYETFAKKRHIILDVYGHGQKKRHACDKKEGVRRIESISLNHPNIINDSAQHVQVVYVDNKTDYAEFAVTTVKRAKESASTNEYWACIGSTKSEDTTAKGALLLCLQDFDIWRSFDILKVKEPSC